MNARRLILSVFATALGALAFAVTPALAVAAEAPKVEEESVSGAASTSATLDAQVNPGGAETAYTFEYAPAGLSFKPVPEAEGSGSLPEGTAGVSLSVHVQGLLPSTSYEFRLVASNSVERVTGEAVSFVTQLARGEFVLPDGRQYEMVTPPEKEGALFFGLGETSGSLAFDEDSEHLIEAATGGNAIVDLTSQPTEPEPQGNGNPLVSVLSTRGTEGWSSQVIAPPHNLVSRLAQGGEYRMFSEDLSHAVVQQFGEFSPLSSEASESTPYLHTDYLDGNVNEHCRTGCFQPLVTHADDTTSPFQRFGQSGCVSFFCGPQFDGASTDLSHVFLSSTVQLTSTPEHTKTTGEEGALYEWSDGHLQLASVFPPGEEGTESEVALAGQYRDVAIGEQEGASRAVSENGGRVIFVTHEGTGPPFGIYMRDIVKGETVRLDFPEPGCGMSCTGSAGLEYMTASSDGSRVFFLDTGRLTADSGAREKVDGGTGANIPKKPDLYECKVGEVDGKLECDLSDMTPERNGESADVAQVLGSSDDGSYVYFAAGGALTPGAVPGECHFDSFEGCNVYVSHDGVTSLVATSWIGGDTAPRWSRASPDGRWFAFMSAKSLTGYDTRDAFSGHTDDEIYLYDASTGRLACASCDPTGARPVGAEDYERNWAAANVPGWTFYSSDYAPLHQPRYLSDSGRLFFESNDALVPQDVDGTEDVYEYEPEGVGGCSGSSSSGSVVVKPAREFVAEGRAGEEGAGCIGLISAGTSGEESSFLDASESGGDVFFLTSERLGPQDFDDAHDVYDAHECTSASPCLVAAVLPPPCNTEASCRAAPTPQPAIFGAPSSATFSGSGNIASLPSSAPASKKVTKKTARCRRPFVKRKDKCVKLKPKKKKGREQSRGGASRAGEDWRVK